MHYSGRFILCVLLLASHMAFCQQESAWQNHHDTVQKKINAIEKKADGYTATVNKSAAKIISEKDSVLQNLQAIPDKFIKGIDKKIDKYSSRITKKTTKTVEKLARWENKIKQQLERVSPETAKRLFGNGQITFSVLLQKMKEGENVLKKYHTQYDAYRDKLVTSFKYLDQQKENLDSKLLEPLAKARGKTDELSETVDNTEAIQQFIRERKKQLLDCAFQQLGKSKYLSKINKESWYYFETMRNYKQLFNDPEKAEQTAKGILSKVPAFQKFVKENSMLASLFKKPQNYEVAEALQGLQSREYMQTMMQGKIASGMEDARQAVSKNIQLAEAELNKLKEKVIKKSGNTAEINMPDFKPNTQKTKTFLQRIEYGSDMQFARTSSILPATSDLAITVGYKLNDRSTVGLGASYKVSLGNIQRIRISNEGAGARSYLNWRLKKQFFISSGYEMNYFTTFQANSNARPSSGSNFKRTWQQSALFGLTKKININSGFLKSTNVQVLYDFMGSRNSPATQSLLFRIGYNF